MMLLATLLLAVSFPQERVPAETVPGLARYPDWPERDFEGRWALWADDAADTPQERREWVQWLAARGEFELLEWIVRSEETGWLLAGEALLAADDPRWIRCAVSALDSGDSHEREAASKDSRRHAGLFLGWLALHPQARVGAAALLAEELEAQGHVAEAAGRYLAPVPDAQLFASLQKAGQADVQPFADRLRAEPGVLYDQSVVRAMRVARARKVPAPQVLVWLLGIARGAHEGLALEACLTFTHFPAPAVPAEELFDLARHADRSLGLRDAAFLGASYGEPRRVWAELHAELLRPGAAQRPIALSRLAELGDAYTLHVLASAALAPQEEPLAEESRRAISSRSPGALDTARVRLLLERAAWADLTSHPIEASLVPWTLAYLREARSPGLSGSLRQVAEADPALDEREASLAFGHQAERVRAYARDLLAAREKD